MKDTLLRFDMSQVRIESVSLEGMVSGQYTKIRYGQDNMPKLIERPGHPELPIQHITIRLPHEAVNVKVTGYAADVVSFNLGT